MIVTSSLFEANMLWSTLSNYNDSSNFKDTNAFGTWQYQVRLALLKDTQNPIHEGQKNDPKSFYHRFGNGFAWDFYTVQLGQMAGDCVDLNTENPIVAKYITDRFTVSFRQNRK